MILENEWPKEIAVSYKFHGKYYVKGIIAKSQFHQDNYYDHLTKQGKKVIGIFNKTKTP